MWDVTNPDNCPEQFAQVLLQELSLDASDNVTFVALEIRKQIETYCANLALRLK